MAGGAGTKTAKRSNPPEPLPPSNFRWFFGHIFSLLRRHGRTLIVCGGLCYFINRASAALIAFAGRQSIADLSLVLVARVTAVWTISLTVSGASLWLYAKERSASRRDRQRFIKRISDLELRLDPHRSSSM